MSQIEVRGHPSAEELAAVVAVLSAHAQSVGPPPSATPVTGGWVDRSRALRRSLLPGPEAWRLSARR